MASRRRSAYVSFSALTLSATALAGCEQRPDPPKVYSSVAECQSEHPGQACNDAWQASVGEHDSTAPHYTRKEECEAQYGYGHCEDRGGFFMPLMAGFILGQMMNHNNGYGYGGGYVGHPVFFSPGGGYRAPIVPAGESVFTRSGGVSRGGFGQTAALRGGFGHFGGG